MFSEEMTLDDRRKQLIEEFSPLEDPQDRLAYVIDMGKMAPGLDAVHKVDTFLIEGCTSNLWLFPEFKGGCCYFSSDADAMITKGIAYLVCCYYSGVVPKEILSHDTEFMTSIGITQHLSPNRRNGLSNLMKKIYGYAQLHASA